MQVLNGLAAIATVPPNAVLSVGNFDGVHRGHQRLLTHGRKLAGEGTPLVVMTFEPHPLTRLRPVMAPPRLTPVAMKHQLLAEAGVDILVELPPDPEVLTITAHDFFALLVGRMKVAHLVEGPDFNFGKGRFGTIDHLRLWSEGTGMQVHVLEEVTVPLTNLNLVEVRSSLIRWLVAYGRVRDAAICLGRPYTLRGMIVKGFQRGRTIGIPTANFSCGEQFVPDDGVYVGRCKVAGKMYAAAVSIGTMPTFGETVRQVEAHLLGFTGDVYGQVLDLELIDYVREQRKYSSLEMLKEQMQRDMHKAQQEAMDDPARMVVAW